MTVFAASGSYEEAKDHGVYAMAGDGAVNRVLFQQPYDDDPERNVQVAQAIEAEGGPQGKVPLVVGVAYFDTQAAAALLDISNTVPMDACTYLGVDSGAMMPFGYSLFLDMIQAMGRDVTKEEFETSCPEARVPCRQALYKCLHGIPLHGEVPSISSIVSTMLIPSHTSTGRSSKAGATRT